MFRWTLSVSRTLNPKILSSTCQSWCVSRWQNQSHKSWDSTGILISFFIHCYLHEETQNHTVYNGGRSWDWLWIGKKKMQHSIPRFLWIKILGVTGLDLEILYGTFTRHKVWSLCSRQWVPWIHPPQGHQRFNVILTLNLEVDKFWDWLIYT